MQLHISPRCLQAWLAGTVIFMGLAACDTNDTAQSVQPAEEPSAAHLAASESVETVTVSEAPARSVTVGSMGGTIRLSDRIGAAYSIALREGGAWLDGVVLLRGSERGWYNKGASEVPLALENFGVGGSLGKHMIVVTPKADGVWIDDSLFVPLHGHNVVLFDGAGGEPAKVGSTSLEPYLGPAPIEDPKQRKALVQQRLRALLENSADIRALWPAE